MTKHLSLFDSSSRFCSSGQLVTVYSSREKLVYPVSDSELFPVLSLLDDSRVSYTTPTTLAFFSSSLQGFAPSTAFRARTPFLRRLRSSHFQVFRPTGLIRPSYASRFRFTRYNVKSRRLAYASLLSPKASRFAPS
jgi:hypothetical protein